MTIAVADHCEKLQAIVAVQDKIPLASKILALVQAPGDKAIALIEYHDGTFLWELESDRPALSDVEQALCRLTSDLGQAGLVPADLRPWNILYQPTLKDFRCIDWGFAFLIGGCRYGKTDDHLKERGHASSSEKEIDTIDAEKTLRVLRQPDQLEAEWNHPSGHFTWRPPPWE